VDNRNELIGVERRMDGDAQKRSRSKVPDRLKEKAESSLRRGSHETREIAMSQRDIRVGAVGDVFYLAQKFLIDSRTGYIERWGNVLFISRTNR